jgi:hypothetical protein
MGDDKNIVCLQCLAGQTNQIHGATLLHLIHQFCYCCQISRFVISGDRNSFGQFQSIKLITATFSNTEDRHSKFSRANFLHIGKQASVAFTLKHMPTRFNNSAACHMNFS